MKRLREINEGTLWGNSIIRSDTDKVRKEDDNSPFFGRDIRYMFYTEGDKRLFTYNEYKEVLKKMKGKGWVSPTIDDFVSVVEHHDYDTTSFTSDDENQVTQKYKEENYIFKAHDGEADEIIVESQYGELSIDLSIGMIGWSGGDVEKDYKTGFWIDEPGSNDNLFQYIMSNKVDDDNVMTEMVYYTCSYQILLLKK